MSALLKVLDANEVLEEVVPLVHHDLPHELAGIGFRFSASLVYLVVDEDDDSLVVTQEIPPGLCEKEPMTGHEPWARARGRGLLWVWRLTNHQGYNDGFQLAFTGRGSGVEALVVQLVGKASTIEVATLERVCIEI